MLFWPKIATALLYVATGVLLVALAHRTVRRLSAAAGLALLLIPLAFTGRALLTGRSYLPFDLAYAAEPLASSAAEYGMSGSGRGILLDVHCNAISWRHAVRWALAHGEWPLWNPFVLSGDPLAASAQPAPYYPPYLPSLLLPLPLSFTFTASIQLLLAALAAFLWLRELGCREEAALLGAAGWALSSFVGFWLEWPLGATWSLVPLVLLAVRRLAAEPGARSAALLAAALVLAVLAGHPESLLHLVGVGTLAGLAEIAMQRSWRSRRPAEIAPVVGWALAAGAAALGATAFFLLPILEVLPQTQQWYMRLAMRESIHAAAPPAAALRQLGFSLLPPQDASPGGFFAAQLASAYAGALLWAPALYGLARSRSRARFALAALGLAGVGLGARAPVLYELLGRLPLFSVSINERLVGLTPLALAGLAALGVEAWMARGGQRGGRGLGALALGLAAALGLGFWALAPHAREAGVAAELLIAGALWGAVPLAAAGAALLARPPVRWGAAVLLLALVAQRAGEMGSFYPALPPEAFYPRVPPLDALPTDGEPYRIVGHHFALIPNDATLWELEDPRGYQAIHHRRLADTLPLWSEPLPVWFNKVTDVSRPFLSFLNVRYVLARRRFRFEGWNLVRRGKGSWLWENPRALSRAFVPKRVRLGTGYNERLREMAAETDFGRRAWIEPPGEGPRQPVEIANARGWAATERRGTGLLLRTRLRRPGWVVISETAWKGWHAREGGRELPLGVANHAFLALELPAGFHEVELFYRPRAFDLGLAVSGATLALLAAAAVLGRRRPRLLRAQRAGDEADAADQQHQHEDGVEEARRPEVDVEVRQDAGEDDHHPGDEQ